MYCSILTANRDQGCKSLRQYSTWAVAWDPWSEFTTKKLNLPAHQMQMSRLFLIESIAPYLLQPGIKVAKVGSSIPHGLWQGIHGVSLVTKI